MSYTAKIKHCYTNLFLNNTVRSSADTNVLYAFSTEIISRSVTFIVSIRRGFFIVKPTSYNIYLAVFIAVNVTGRCGNFSFLRAVT